MGDLLGRSSDEIMGFQAQVAQHARDRLLAKVAFNRLGFRRQHVDGNMRDAGFEPATRTRHLRKSVSPCKRVHWRY